MLFGLLVMGRNNKSMKKEIVDEFQKKLRYNVKKKNPKSESDPRREYKRDMINHGKTPNPIATKYIHSIETNRNYFDRVMRFHDFLKAQGVKKMKDVTFEHAKNYLLQRQDRGLSSWTTSLDMAAINKIFELGLTKKNVGLKRRNYKDAKRSRKEAKMDYSVNYDRYEKQIEIAKATGIRRQSMLKLERKHFEFRDGLPITVWVKEKGGRERNAPILEIYRERVAEILKESPKVGPLFEMYPKNIDNHAFRHQYAKEYYDERLQALERPIRSDYKGYDKEVLKIVSKALGHNRVDVVVYSYLR